MLQGAIDVDSNGSIDYEEFLASTVSTQHLEKEETMRKAFQHFDADNSGYITRDELHSALQVRWQLQVVQCCLAGRSWVRGSINAA